MKQPRGAGRQPDPAPDTRAAFAPALEAVGAYVRRHRVLFLFGGMYLLLRVVIFLL